LKCGEKSGLHHDIQSRQGRSCHGAWSLLGASEFQPPETTEQVTTVRFDGVDPLKHSFSPEAARQGRPKKAGVSELVERARIFTVLEAAQCPPHRVRRYRGLRLHLTRVFSHPAPPQQICSSSLGTLPDNFRLTNRPTTFKSLWRVSWQKKEDHRKTRALSHLKRPPGCCEPGLSHAPQARQIEKMEFRPQKRIEICSRMRRSSRAPKSLYRPSTRIHLEKTLLLTKRQKTKCPSSVPNSHSTLRNSDDVSPASPSNPFRRISASRQETEPHQLTQLKLCKNFRVRAESFPPNYNSDVALSTVVP